MQAISVKLPPALRRRLAEEAKRRNVTQSAVLREIIESALGSEGNEQRPASCADLARDLLGSVRSGKTDLATNEHLLAEAMLEDRKRADERRR